LDQLLFIQVSKGETHTARELIKHKLVDTNFSDLEGTTILHVACHNDSFKFIKFLIENGYKKQVNAKDKDGWIPLFYASVIGNPLIVKLLIDNGSEINVKDRNGRLPLHMAGKSGKASVVKYLLEKGQNVNDQTIFGYTALFMSVNFPEVIRILVEQKGVKVDLPDFKGHTPLQYAIQSKQLESIAFLIKGGANINQKDSNGYSPLHFAISSGNEEIALHLIKLGADIKVKDNDGQTPMHISLNSNFPDLFRELVQQGEDPNIFDPFFKTYPIQMAAGNGFHLLLDVFLQSNVDLNTETEEFPWSPNQSTPLMNAVAGGHTDFVKTLLSYGKCDVNRQDKLFHQTPLHLAVELGDFEIVKVLLKNGAKVNIQDCYGRTPALIAKQYKRKEIHQLLKKYGADLTIQDKVGNSAFYEFKSLYALEFIDLYSAEFPQFSEEKLDHVLKRVEAFLVVVNYKNTEHLCRKTKFYSTQEAVDTYCELHFLSSAPYFLKTISYSIGFKPIQTPSSICLRNGSYFDFSLESASKNMTMILSEDLSLPKALEATEKLCLYLSSLHQQNYIHKNLSLDAYYHNDRVNAYVLSDIGTPALIRLNQRQTFNAPELKKSNFQGHTIYSDIYSLGTTLFEAFCKEKYDPKYTSMETFNYQSVSPIISKYILPVCFSSLIELENL
jgi:ankyrin repeat protein